MAKSQLEAAQHLDDAERMARQAARHPAARWLARAGYTAKGIVYILIGGLAVQLALGAQGAAPDRQTALYTIYNHPFGKVLLGLVAVGLLGYGLWSLAQGALDLDGRGTKAKAILQRIGYGAIGLSYLALGGAAAQLALGLGTAGKTSDASAHDWTVRLLHAPFGVALIVLVGLVVLGIAAALFAEAYTAHFQRQFKLGEMPAEARNGVIALGRFGLGALAVVFTVIGIFLIVAALRHDAGQARGLGGALVALAAQPFGHLLVAIVALGFVAYGLYSFAEARYRRLG